MCCVPSACLISGGSGGLSSKMLEALQALMIACAKAGVGDALLGSAEEALDTVDGYPPPFPEFSAALRQLASRELRTVSTALPSELQQLLSGIIEAIRKK